MVFRLTGDDTQIYLTKDTLAGDRLPRRQDSRPHRRIRPRRAARRHHAGEGGRHVVRGRASSGAFRPRPSPWVAGMAGTHGAVRAGRIDGREGLFAGQRGRGGFLRRDEGRVRLPRAVGGAHPWEVLALIDECTHWFNYDRVKQSRGH